MLCYFEGHSCDAAARRLRRPVGTVKARLSRARGMLRQRLIRRGVVLPAGLLAADFASGATAAVVPVPAALSRMTVAFACSTLIGAATVPVRVALLAEGVLRVMFLRKLTLTAVLLTVPAALLGGTVLIARGSSGPGDGPGPEAQSPAVQAPAAPVDRPPVGKIGGDDPAGRALRDVLPVAVKTADPYSFTFALIRLARARNASGDREGALAAFRLADQVADTVKVPHLRRLAMMRTAVARGKLGDTEPARATLDHFAREAAGLGPEQRYDLMSMVIDFLGDAGFKAEAEASLKDELARVNALPTESLKDGGIYRLIYNQATIGDYDGALRQVERYTGERSNYRQSLLDIIVRYTSTIPGRFAPRQVVERALELSREITYPSPRRWPRPRSPRRSPAPAMSTGHSRSPATSARAKAAPSRNPSARRSPPPWPRSPGSRPRRGDIDGARKTLREAWALSRTVTQRSGVLFDRVRRIAEAAAEIGDVEAAGLAADEIDEAQEKAFALVALARARVKAGDAPAAQITLDEALKYARGIGRRANVINDNPVGNADQVFRVIAVAKAEAGDAKGAVATVAIRGSEAWKSGVLAAIAPIQARQGDIPGALATARSIPQAAQAGGAYCEIASIQARKDGAEAALAWAGRLEPPAVRAYALIGIAEGLAARPAERRAGDARKP